MELKMNVNPAWDNLPATTPSASDIEAWDNARADVMADRIIESLNKKLDNAPDVYEDLVASKYLDSKARDAASKRLEAEQSPSGYRALDVQPLDVLLASPDVPLEWRIGGFAQKGHNITLAARYKVGKTSLVTNLLRSLVDGDDFLGIYSVSRVTRPVVVFNHELSDAQFTAWLRKAGIRNTHLIIPVNLRGKGLYLQDEAAAEWAIELLKRYEAEVWIIDPLQAALRGTVNDDTVASEWIGAADRVKAEAGVSELFLVTHTGHLSKADESGRSSNERSAGSARWSGWPDALWTYTMDDAGTRYLAAEGRDISVDEFALGWDEASGHLTSLGLGTGRQERKADAPYRAIIEVFKANPDAHLTRQEVERILRKSNKIVTDGLRDAEYAQVIARCDCDHRAPGAKGPKPAAYILTGTGKWALKA